MKIKKHLLIAGLIAIATNSTVVRAAEFPTRKEVLSYLKELESELFGKTVLVAGPGFCPGTYGFKELSNAPLSSVQFQYSNAEQLWNYFRSQYYGHINFKLTQKFPEWTKRELDRLGGIDKLVLVDDSVAKFETKAGANGGYCFDDSINLCGGTVFIALSLEAKAANDPSLSRGASVEQSIFALGTALKEIKLLPSQRKVLKSFFDAAKRMYEAVDAEQKKAAKGERAKQLMHRDFIAQTTLLVAYYRYLQESLAESAELSSERSGVDTTNVWAVQVIDTAISNLVESYGLEGDISSKQIADYGRVLGDLLLHQLAPLVDEAKRKKFIRPATSLLARLVARSEANGDLSAQDDVRELKATWESPEFTQFMTEWLTTSDTKMNGLILNINSLAYKIGLAANIQIKVFQKEDVDRVKAGKGKK